MLQGVPVGTHRSWITEATTAVGTTAATLPLSVVADADARVGTVLGSYLLRCRIGEGAMGHVYMAEHVRLGRRVALKILRSELASRRSALARFVREARIVAGIHHRNIVHVEDLVEPASGPPYLVMELLRGCSLRDHLRTGGAFGAAEVVEIGAQICSALEAVHGVGVLHRDLTPGNVHVCADRGDGDGWIKLLDFGIAKLCDCEACGDDAAQVTAEGTIIGTPGYMSPEQATGGPIDARSDLYSLGAILYEATCDEAVVTGQCMADYVRAHVATPPRPLRTTSRGRSAPPQLEAIVMRCLAKRPEDRPASAAAVRAELLALRARVRTRSWRWRATGAMAVTIAAAAAIGDASPRSVEHSVARGLTPSPPALAPVEVAASRGQAARTAPAVSSPAPEDECARSPVREDRLSPPPRRVRRSASPAGAQTVVWPDIARGRRLPPPIDPAKTVDPFAIEP